MANEVQYNKPLTLNMDKSPKISDSEDSFFIRNQERFLNRFGEVTGTLGKTTPMVANKPLCELDQPGGENYTIGSYYSNLTNELYDFVYNHNGVNYIKRASGSGECEIVYFGSCLLLNPAPKHSIEQWRAYLKVDKLCANMDGKYLIWADGINPIGMLDVEASIATNNFSTPFFDRCADPCALLQMCVPDPCGCLKGEFVPVSLADAGLKNNLLDVGIKIAYRHIYYDGRAGIYSDPSTLFYQDTRGCFDSGEGFPRCIKMRVPIGNPLVELIEIVFIKDGVPYLYDTIDKYKKYNSTQEKWYERGLAELANYSDEDCSFDYYFCNDKQCDAIDPKEFARVFNPIPREPQGFFTIEDVLAFYNYKQGSCPIDQSQIEKMDIGIDCPEDNCQSQFTTVTTYAVVHNRAHNRNQPIFRLGGAVANEVDDKTDIAFFGGLNQVGSGDLELGHGQQFSGDIRNFIAYLEGTTTWDEAKQFKADPGFVNKEEWGTLANFDEGATKNRWRRAIRNGQYFYQKIEFKVLKGTRGFLRLASHNATGNEQNTSTFVVGILNDITNYSGDTTINSTNTDLTTEEIYIDTCNHDTIEIKKAFVIDDNAIDAGLSTKASSYGGYVHDEDGIPIEGAVVQYAGVQSKTDHNGYYHFALYPGTNDAISINVKVEQDCADFTAIQNVSVQSETGAHAEQDVTITSETWPDTFFSTVKIKVEDCESEPVGGIRVALSGSKYRVSAADGYATFRIRNYSTRDRVVRAVVLNNNGCLNVDCNGACNPCMPTSSASTLACYQSEPEVILSNAVINRDSILVNRNGLKSGGRYPFGFFVRYGCGKISPVYEIKYLDIPKTQEKNREGFCSLSYNGNNITLPSDATCLSIVRGANINPFELRWVVDSIERTTDGKIKLTFQSLIDYNERFLFKTNTLYKWLKGDRVEFIKNGDNKIFSIAEHGLLNYLAISPFHDELISGEEDAEADFFNQLLINDDGKLDGLTEGAVIEIQRSKECTTDPVYFSICVNIPIVDGKLLYDSGVFHSFDTYNVNRQIGALPAQSFEHHSPSDFWGERLTDAGRPYFVNEFENEERFGRNISVNTVGEFNRFGDIVKTLNPKSHGDIIAIWVVDDKVGIVISEHDNSLIEVSDDLARVGADGILRAAPADQIISDTQAKISGSYGCQYPHIGSILFDDGWVGWCDVNRHTYVEHDYRQAVPADEGKVQSYFRRRCQEIETYNRANSDPLNQFRFATGKNYHTGAVMITIKALRDSGINNEPKPYAKRNDTIMYHPVSKDWLGFCSFTPESYGRLDLFDGAGCAFVTFLNGLPYVHPIIPDKWNEWYGIACDLFFGIDINKGGEKIKIPLALEIQSETMFFVKEVVTDKPNFKSEIPPVRFKKDARKWNAAFLGNLNSREGLYGSERPRGYYARILLIRDNTIDLQYNTTNDQKRTAYSELDAVISKYALYEQSGFQVNV